MEVSAAIGEKILDAFPDASVDVHNPEMTLSVEIRDKIYVYSETLPGPGGMPVGTAGKAMLLLSGGIDSPVAGWMTAKRGVVVVCSLLPRTTIHIRKSKTESCGFS